MCKVDILGSALFAAFLILVLLPLELGGSKIAWNDPQIPIYFGLAALSLVLLVVVEKWWASNPLLPLSMFHNRHTVAAFVILALQSAAQLGVSVTIPAPCSEYYFDIGSPSVDDVHRSAVFPSDPEYQ